MTITRTWMAENFRKAIMPVLITCAVAWLKMGQHYAETYQDRQQKAAASRDAELQHGLQQFFDANRTNYSRAWTSNALMRIEKKQDAAIKLLKARKP